MYPWSHISPPEKAVLDRALSRIKGQLLLLEGKGAGFLGSLLCDHNYTWDESAPTAWCDGSTIGFNPSFFTWMTPESRITVLAHELWHTGYDHMSRAMEQDRNPMLWNIAGDHVINLGLVGWGYDFSQLEVIGPCKDPRFTGMTTEQVYEILLKELPKPKPMPAPGQSGDPLPSPGESQEDAQGKGQDPAQGDGTGQGPQQDPNQPLLGDVRPVDGPEAMAQIKAAQIKAVQASAMAKEAGIVPGEITVMIENFLDPVLPWEILLERFYTDLSKEDYSWKRPNRRYDHEYLPSLNGDNGLEHLIYYIDISGSTTDEMVLRFFSEVHHIHEHHRPKRITMKTFDTKLQDVWELEQDDPFIRFEIHGRGGTDLTEVEEDIRKLQPTAAIIFTDLYVVPMRNDPGVPILWACMNNPKATVPFGRLIHVKEE